MKHASGTSTWALALAGLLAGTSVQASCPSSLTNRLKSLERELAAYRPSAPSLGGGGGAQAGNMNTAGTNSAAASAAAQKCSGELTAFAKRFDELKEELESNEGCSNETERAEKGKKSAEQKAGQCAAAGGAANKQGDKNKDNEKKMGEGGGMPQMPQIPQKKEEKKEDLQQCLNKLASCKSGVTSNLEVKKKNCEINIPYDSSHPVKEQKQKQDECKQQKIFETQSELAQCDAANPTCGGGYGSSLSDSVVTKTDTSTATTTAPSSSTSTGTGTGTSGITK